MGHRQKPAGTSRKPGGRRAWLHKRLQTYSAMVAAVAAGAAAQSADAVIIANSPLNIPLFNNFPGGFGIDFDGTDNDTTGDDIFIFHGASVQGVFTTTNMMGVKAATGNSVVGYFLDDYVYASRLAFSSPIGQSPGTSMINPNLGIVQSAATMRYGIEIGPWNEDTYTGTPSGFIGAKFQIDATTHFGWIAVEVDNAMESGTITGYAYESNPNTPIGAGHLPPPSHDVIAEMSSSGVIPEPTHLGLLALGAAGVAALRRRKRQAS